MHYLLIFIFVVNLFAINFDSYKSFNELKADLKKENIQNKIELEILSLIMNNDDKDANFLFKILKNPVLIKKDNKILDNVLYTEKNRYVILVEKDLQRILLMYNGKTIKEAYMPCITGKKQGDKFKEGDQKTPEGIYFPKTFIAQNRLSKIYGEGAFPLNYPNILDKRLYKKSGHGIWLHSTDNPNRKPFSSNGCVVLTKKYFDFVRHRIDLKSTPVIIMDKFRFSDIKSHINEERSLGYFIYRWKRAWEKSVMGNIKEYKELYSKHMVSIRGGYKQFMEYKKSVSSRKKWIKINLSDLYLLKDGRVLDYGRLYVAAFRMDYKSNNYDWKGRKVLYIIKDNGKWKILAEESL